MATWRQKCLREAKIERFGLGSGLSGASSKRAVLFYGESNMNYTRRQFLENASALGTDWRFLNELKRELKA